jgi:hypothetical protein
MVNSHTQALIPSKQYGQIVMWSPSLNSSWCEEGGVTRSQFSLGTLALAFAFK